MTSGARQHGEAGAASSGPLLSCVKAVGGLSTLMHAADDLGAAALPGASAMLAMCWGGSPRPPFGAGNRSGDPRHRRGDALFLAGEAADHHGSRQQADGPWFQLLFAPGLMAQATAAHGQALADRAFVRDARLTALVEMVFDLASRPEDPNPLLWEPLAHLVLWRLFQLQRPDLPHEMFRGGLAAWQVRRTTQYIADHLDRRVSLQELAEVARLSPFHFARAFAHSVGCPPYRYQQNLRLDRACELLSGTSQSIIEIALSVGYESPQAFARMFSKRFGMPPSQWRSENP